MLRNRIGDEPQGFVLVSTLGLGDKQLVAALCRAFRARHCQPRDRIVFVVKESHRVFAEMFAAIDIASTFGVIMIRTFCLVALLMVLTACETAIPIDRTAAPTPAKIADGSGRSLRLQRISSDIANDADVGTVCNQLCYFRHVYRYSDARRVLETRRLADAFATEAQRVGYSVVGDPNTLVDNTPADLLVGAIISNMKINLNVGLPGVKAPDGEIRLEIKWVIFDPATKRVVREIETSGFTRLYGKDQGDRIMAAMAFGEATRALLADPQFAALATAAPAAAPPPQAVAANLTVAREPTRTSPLEQSLPQVRAAVVTIPGGDVPDRGFVISRSGLVLVTSGAVGPAAPIRVTLADGRTVDTALVGRDPRRKIALLKLAEPVPTALALAPADLPVSSEVLMLGAGTAGTPQVRRGVISAYRTIDDIRYIQSDIPVQSGDFGAPVVDRTGNVIGIAVRGTVTPSGAPLGLSFVVPIADALSGVGVTVEPPR